jgi:hypothetical protein
MFGNDERSKEIKHNTEALLILATTILSGIKTLNNKEDKIMANMAELDATLAGLATAVSAVGDGVTRLAADFKVLEDKLAQGVDTTAEVAAVNAAIAALQGNVAAIDAADPAPVVEPPVEEPAPEAPAE